MIGMIQIGTSSTLTLFDLGATHAFVSYDHVIERGLHSVAVDQQMLVGMPDGNIMSSMHVCKACSI
jgi:hypothetical protein